MYVPNAHRKPLLVFVFQGLTIHLSFIDSRHQSVSLLSFELRVPPSSLPLGLLGLSPWRSGGSCTYHSPIFLSISYIAAT